MLAQTLNAGEGRSAAAAVGGGRADGMRAGGSPASAAPLPPDNSELDPPTTYTRYVGFPHRARTAFAACSLLYFLSSDIIGSDDHQMGAKRSIRQAPLAFSFGSLSLSLSLRSPQAYNFLQ